MQPHSYHLNQVWDIMNDSQSDKLVKLLLGDQSLDGSSMEDRDGLSLESPLESLQCSLLALLSILQKFLPRSIPAIKLLKSSRTAMSPPVI